MTRPESWAFGTRFSPEHESIDDYGDDRVADMIRAAAGLPHADVTLRPQIPGTDRKVLAFTIGTQVARQYRAGRVFFVGGRPTWCRRPEGSVGTPASRTPTTWHGSSPPCSMDTPHRRCSTPTTPSGTRSERSRCGKPWRGSAPAWATAERTNHWSTTRPAYGYQYRSTAVIGAGKDTTPLAPAELRGQPGTRAPHVTVAHDSSEISTIDLYGERFVLLAGSDGIAWTTAAERVADELGARRLSVRDRSHRHRCGHRARNRIHRCCARASRRLRGLAQSHAVAEPANEMERALRSILANRRPSGCHQGDR